MLSYAPRSQSGRFAVLVLLALALAALSNGSVRAQAAPDSARPASAAVKAQAADTKAPAGYDEAIDLAFHEFELGNYAEARARFLEAHKLFPNARTLRALGMVEYELKNYGDAIESLEKALASPVRALEGPTRADTQALLERAKGYIARINLDLNPDAATVVVDGVPVQLGMGGILLLQVGDHSLEFRAPGRQVEKRQLKITGGEQRTLQVVLPPLLDPHAKPKAEARPLRKNPWLWTAVGVVAVGTAVGLGVGLSDPASHSGDPQGGSTGVTLAGPP